MICSKISRKIKKLLGIKTQMIFAEAQTQVVIASTARIVNSRIEIKGSAILIVDDDVVIRDTLIVLHDSTLHISHDTILEAVNMFAKKNSTIHIGEKNKITKYDYMVSSARFTSRNECHFVQGRNALRPYFSITNGSVCIEDHNVIRADFWVRFGGQVAVGQYNCINERTEIRSDEAVTIGNFNMISYDCSIWDTNTHCLYDAETRRAMTKQDFPNIGNETERPKTKPIVIGNDCWIGKHSSILKGSNLGDCVVVATKTIISNQIIENGKMAHPAKAIVNYSTK